MEDVVRVISKAIIISVVSVLPVSSQGPSLLRHTENTINSLCFRRQLCLCSLVMEPASLHQ